jgi:hypothetical protein
MKLQNNWRRLLRRAAKLISEPGNWITGSLAKRKLVYGANLVPIDKIKRGEVNKKDCAFCMLGAIAVCDPAKENLPGNIGYSAGSPTHKKALEAIETKARKMGLEFTNLYAINDRLLRDQKAVAELLLNTANDPEIKV